MMRMKILIEGREGENCVYSVASIVNIIPTSLNHASNSPSSPHTQCVVSKSTPFQHPNISVYRERASFIPNQEINCHIRP